ncbi:putative phosphatase PhoE [Lysinibacillus sp. PLM2]|nr:putative phosphatase PhoE [Lysinibacillus sp. PLM2]
MTLICLVRHGETDWNTLRKIQGRKDIPLNQNGSTQAKDCRNYLSAFEWNVIVTSPLRRAKQTAEIINGKLNLPLIVMENFIERDYGDVEGLTIEERALLYPEKNCINQESVELVSKRVFAGINKLHKLYPEQKIIIVAHGGIIKVLLNSILKDKDQLQKSGVPNGSINTIYIENGEWKVKGYNHIEHLSNTQKTILR